MLSTLINIIAAPRLAYAQLKEAPSMLLPLLLLVASVSLTTFTYFHMADPALLMDDLLEQATQDMSEAERKEAEQGMQNMPTGALKWISTLSGSLGMLVVFLLHAGYYYLVSMFSGTKIGYRAWLGFVSWSNVPILFSSVASLATLLLASQHIPLQELNPLTLTNLLGFESDNSAIRNTMNNLDLTRLWCVALMLIGYRVWTGASWLQCTLVVMLPLLLLVGSTFVFSF